MATDPLSAPELPVVCGRCGYNRRGLPAERACPECGTAAPRIAEATGSGLERWEPLHDGLWQVGNFTWCLIPLAIGCYAATGHSSLLSAIVFAHGIGHWIGVRAIGRGLEGITEEPLASDMRAARRDAQIHAGVCAAGLLLTPLGGFFHLSPVRTVLLGAAVATATLALRSLQSLLPNIAPTSAQDRGWVRRHLDGSLLIIGALLAACLLLQGGMAIMARLTPAALGVAQPLAIGLYVAAAVAGPLFLAAGLAVRLTALEAATLVPQLPAFNLAAARAARSTRRQTFGPRRSTPVEELPPIPLAGEGPLDER